MLAMRLSEAVADYLERNIVNTLDPSKVFKCDYENLDHEDINYTFGIIFAENIYSRSNKYVHVRYDRTKYREPRDR